VTPVLVEKCPQWFIDNELFELILTIIINWKSLVANCNNFTLNWKCFTAHIFCKMTRYRYISTFSAVINYWPFAYHNGRFEPNQPLIGWQQFSTRCYWSQVEFFNVGKLFVVKFAFDIEIELWRDKVGIVKFLFRHRESRISIRYFKYLFRKSSFFNIKST